MLDSEVRSTKAINARGDAHISTRSTQASQHTTHTASMDRKDTTLSSRIRGTPVVVSSPSLSSSSISIVYPSANAQPSRSTTLGPVVSAMPQSTAQTSVSPDGATSRPSDLSGGSRNAVIAATTIVGTLILAFIIYMIWRMRRGSTHSGFLCCGDRSDTITLTTSRGGTMTALPIYRENRYSVRSSRIGSKLSLGKYRRERFDRDHPWTQNAWKPQNPPTPTSPLANAVARPPSPPLKHLGATRVYSSNTMETRMAKNISEDTTKSGGVDIGVQAASDAIPPTESVFGLPIKPPEPPQKDRWSWTNADAPPTPRFAAPSIGKSSLSSLPRFRSVASWVRGQAARQGLRTEEPPVPSSQGSSMPILKNKASKPNLLPGPPTRKLSKNKRNDSNVNPARQSMDDTGIAAPTLARLNDKRPPSPPKAEDGLFVSYS